jgi:hypothetical protein
MTANSKDITSMPMMFVVAVSILQYHLLCASSLVTRCDWCCGCQAGLFAMLLAVEAVIV